VASRNEVLLMTRERDTERAVDVAIENSPNVARQFGVCPDIRELIQRLENRQAAVALIDVDPQPMTALSGVEPLVRKFPNTRFVVICRDPRPEVLDEAMQVGARRCVNKASLSADLPAVLKRLLQDVSTAGPEGSIVTVLSASGGSGCTTVAINLADELRLASGKESLLIDMDRFYGAAATYLGVQGNYGIVDLLAQRGTIDAQLVTTTALKSPQNLHVLLSPATVNFADPLPMPYDQIDVALTACRQAFGFTVIDAPRMPMDVAATLAQSSVLTMIVFELAVIDIRCARAMLTALVDLRVPRERILFVLNRYRKRGTMITFDEAQKALEGMAIRPLSNDFEGTLRSINLGQTLSQAAPRSDLRKDLRDLAAHVIAQGSQVARDGH
jgi:pilus assembly protein CpaE